MNPFLTNIRNLKGERCAALDAGERLRMVHEFDAAQCRAALKIEELQKTVRAAVERRLRKLECQS